MDVLKHLSKLNDLPDALRNRIFKKLFEQAKIAKMTKEEMDDYQYSLLWRKSSDLCLFGI